MAKDDMDSNCILLQDTKAAIGSLQQGISPENTPSKDPCGEDSALYEITLMADTDRYELLRLVKKARKTAGFTPRMIDLLDYYIAFTRDCDWEQGGRPIVYQSIAKTALDLEISERQVQRLERQLFEAGALAWHDSGNHKRYGKRDPKTGYLVFAFGVDLTPLANLKADLESILAKKSRNQEEWLEIKRQISWYRGKICGYFAQKDDLPQFYQEFLSYEHSFIQIKQPIRTYMSLEALKSLLDQHKDLLNAMQIRLKTEQRRQIKPVEVLNAPDNEGSMSRKESCSDEENVAHIEITNISLSDKSECNRRKTRVPKNQTKETDLGSNSINQKLSLQIESLHEKAGLQHITLNQAIEISGERLKMYLGDRTVKEINWQCFVDAAYRLAGELGISQGLWAECCEILGRSGAALCLVLTDRGLQRSKNKIQSAPAYYKSLIKKARAGELSLHRSVFGILQSHSLM